MEHLSFTSHPGSHVDAPLHKLQGGKAIDQFPLERWTGPARIVDLRGIGAGAQITASMLEKKLNGSIENQFVLLATGWSERKEQTGEPLRQWLHDPPVLAADGARYLAEHGARGVGIDHYSIGDATTHAILLGELVREPVLIVEELKFPPEVFSLKQPVEFWALPINLRGHSGAPCRPVLVVR